MGIIRCQWPLSFVGDIGWLVSHRISVRDGVVFISAFPRMSVRALPSLVFLGVNPSYTLPYCAVRSSPSS